VSPSPVSRRRVYVDTSAYLCILLGESGSDRMSAATDGAELVSSVLLVLEAGRTLVRLAREGTLTPAQYALCVERLATDQASFVLRDLTLDLCRSKAMPPVATPRSPDLAHLRTALWFHTVEPLTRFLSADVALTQAADELGLPV
jgi:hypothetical protein